jgi:hypothetical protein
VRHGTFAARIVTPRPQGYSYIAWVVSNASHVTCSMITSLRIQQGCTFSASCYSRHMCRAWRCVLCRGRVYISYVTPFSARTTCDTDHALQKSLWRLKNSTGSLTSQQYRVQNTKKSIWNVTSRKARCSENLTVTRCSACNTDWPCRRASNDSASVPWNPSTGIKGTCSLKG